MGKIIGNVNDFPTYHDSTMPLNKTWGFFVGESDVSHTYGKKVASSLLQRRIDKNDKTGSLIENEVDNSGTELDPLFVNSIRKLIQQNNAVLNSLVRKSDLPQNTEFAVQEVIKKMELKLRLLKYYSFVWVISVILIATFLIVGVSGFIGPFTSIIGASFCLIGGIGAFFDWKDREKNVS